MTNAALAEAVGLTPTPMLQRMRKLEQSGVISRYMAVVDPAKVGRTVTAFVMRPLSWRRTRIFLSIASRASAEAVSATI